ncbi:MAG: hypothetical protein PHH26_06705, partial [Candidatus Thermoplasmatota archaeon]|nr:hypothetical protein [Candidatus Thermoplasmatota archaeon]
MKASKFAFAVAMVGMMVLGVFAGCTGTDEASNIATKAPASLEKWTAQTNDLGEIALLYTTPMDVALLSTVSARDGKFNPVLSTSSELLSMYSKTIGTAASAATKLPADPANLSIELAKLAWTKSDGAFLVSDYKSALVVAPFASMLSVPVFYVGNDTKAIADELNALGVKETVSVGDCPVLDGFTAYKISID